MRYPSLKDGQFTTTPVMAHAAPLQLNDTRRDAKQLKTNSERYSVIKLNVSYSPFDEARDGRWHYTGQTVPNKR